MKIIPYLLPQPRRGYLHYHYHHLHQSSRSLVDEATVTLVRDRALDHAVEKERDLKPMHNLMSLIISEPSKSLPLNIVAQSRNSLNLPIRPIDFARKYPSIFEVFHPADLGIYPHVRLTPEVISLSEEEQLVTHTESHKLDVADRLLKLLMICRTNRVPLRIIDSLRWDLGLPQDYQDFIVPDFPDYFQVNGSWLELVCWSNELAVSVMEKKAMRGETRYRKGMPLAFPLQYSRGFEMDKKFKKWVDDWQKLPYISPYENALHLQPNSDESDKWTVGVLHELLSLFVPKKTEKDNLLLIGDYLGVRSRFKRAVLHHPGIFYVSSKLRVHTVVLREGYKRDLLVAKHPLMDMRSKYYHLMNMPKEDQKLKTAKEGKKKKKKSKDSKEEEGQNVENEGEEELDREDLSGSEFEDESDDDYDDEEEEDEDEEERARFRSRTTRKEKFDDKSLLTAVSYKRGRRNFNKIMDKSPTKISRRTEMTGGHNARARTRDRSNVSRIRGGQT